MSKTITNAELEFACRFAQLGCFRRMGAAYCDEYVAVQMIKDGYGTYEVCVALRAMLTGDEEEIGEYAWFIACAAEAKVTLRFMRQSGKGSLHQRFELKEAALDFRHAAGTYPQATRF